jgi:tetratricopeptide (TPR) repeat protein
MRLRARVLFDAGCVALLWGDTTQARVDFDESVALYETLGDRSGLADALRGAGSVAQRTDAETALALLERSAALYRMLGDDASLVEVLGNLGGTARFQGNYAQGEAFYAEALRLAHARQNEEEIAEVLESLGTLALHQQAPTRAISALEESVRLLRQQRYGYTPIKLGWALIHLAEARRVAGDTPDGVDGAAHDASIRELWEEGLALLRDMEARWAIAQALLEIGEMVYEQGDNARAAELLRESVAGFHSLDAIQELGHALDAVGALWADGGRPGALRQAVQLWSAATTWHQNRPRMSPIRRSRYERTFAAARSQLGEGLFAAAWEDGQRLSLEQAVTYTLGATSLP